jgi:hypothetical protein
VYIAGVKAGDRPQRLTRVLAVAAALTVAAEGGGVPMCVSLFAEAAAPCPMHEHPSAPGHDLPTAALTVALSGHGSCHGDAASLGCAAGGVCPTGGTAAPAAASASLTVLSSGRAAALAVDAARASFLAPPLPPPPQA